MALAPAGSRDLLQRCRRSPIFRQLHALDARPIVNAEEHHNRRVGYSMLRARRKSERKNFTRWSERARILGFVRIHAVPPTGSLPRAARDLKRTRTPQLSPRPDRWGSHVSAPSFVRSTPAGRSRAARCDADRVLGHDDPYRHARATTRESRSPCSPGIESARRQYAPGGSFVGGDGGVQQ